MMRTFLSMILCLVAFCPTVYVSAQTLTDQCDSGRYIDSDFFTDIIKTSTVNFGRNRAATSSQIQELFMDIYEPDGDTAALRPLLILAFGGTFITGDRNQVAPLCSIFTKMGYVTAAIDYRIGFFFPDQRATTLAVVRAMHDMRAAIRFFRKDIAEDGNTYRIDPQRIIAGGISAGAITAIQTAYLDKTSEIPAYLYGDTAAFGGIEGTSGNPGYSSTVAAVVNFSGTIGDSLWMEENDVPIVSFHETGDNVVPIDTRMIFIANISTGLVGSGSRDLSLRAANTNTPFDFWEIGGNGHVAYLTGQANIYQDSVVNRTKAFLCREVLAKEIITKVKTLAQPIAYDYTIFPNPLKAGDVQWQWSGDFTPRSIQLSDIHGKVWERIQPAEGQQFITRPITLPAGMYLLQTTLPDGNTSIRRLQVF